VRGREWRVNSDPSREVFVRENNGELWGRGRTGED